MTANFLIAHFGLFFFLSWYKFSLAHTDSLFNDIPIKAKMSFNTRHHHYVFILLIKCKSFLYKIQSSGQLFSLNSYIIANFYKWKSSCKLTVQLSILSVAKCLWAEHLEWENTLFGSFNILQKSPIYCAPPSVLFVLLSLLLEICQPNVILCHEWKQRHIKHIKIAVKNTLNYCHWLNSYRWNPIRTSDVLTLTVLSSCLKDKSAC